jgi:hypothetical protein
MIVALRAGRTWNLEDVPRKLAQRAGLPGARVYDLSADALRQAKDLGLSNDARLPLACPGSWLVNSPAASVVFRRWVLPPSHAILVDLLSRFDPPEMGPLAEGTRAAFREAIPLLGKEPILVEALSKMLALLVPHAIPLMPPLAVTFVLGQGARSPAETFIAMADWFGSAVEEHWDELAGWAAGHAEVRLDAAQVLDRLLWFDSDGFKHFQGKESPK